MSLPPSSDTWDSELDVALTGWLLPASARKAIAPEAAARFLSRLTGRPDHLDLLRASSLFVAHGEELAVFLDELLPALVRVLPARTRVEARTWEGGFHGRLDIRATQQLRQAGHVSRFVTRTRRRDFALPENVLLEAVAAWLLRELDRLLSTLPVTGWLEPLAEHAVSLRRLLHASVLQEIESEPITGHHLRAARAAAHPAYRAAAQWYRRLRVAFDDGDPVATAALLAKGALRPVHRAKRFEVAVLVRLIRALWEQIQGTRDAPLWTMEHNLIRQGRDEVVVFSCADGASISVYYDVSPLPGGRRWEALQHYLGGAGSQRPDIALCRTHPDGTERWAVIEIKCSDNRSYIASGFDEALAYRAEYGARLGGWPEAVLVSSCDIPGDVRTTDPVIAVDWRRWVPPGVALGLTDGLTREHQPVESALPSADVA